VEGGGVQAQFFCGQGLLGAIPTGGYYGNDPTHFIGPVLVAQVTDVIEVDAECHLMIKNIRPHPPPEKVAQAQNPATGYYSNQQV
jgi:hypothetical protein